MTTNKTEANHTPLPWILSEEIDDSITKAAGYPMRWLEGPMDQVCAIPGGNDQSDCDAELIVRAVNSHAELLQLCKDSLDIMVNQFGFDEGADIVIDLRAAIAKAEAH